MGRDEVDGLVGEHGAWARGVARGMRRRLPGCFDIDDLEQAALIGLWRAAEAYDPARGVPFRLWALTRVRGSVFEAVRRRNWTESMHEELQERDLLRESPEEAIASRALVERLDRLIGELPERQRRVMEWSYADGLQLDEIAERLGVSITTACALRQQALREIRAAVGVERHAHKEMAGQTGRPERLCVAFHLRLSADCSHYTAGGGAEDRPTTGANDPTEAVGVERG